MALRLRSAAVAAPEGFDFQLEIPPELLGGVYANVLNVWHSEWEFTLDFGAVMRMPEAAEEPAPCIGAARVRIPVILIFDVLKALNEEMTEYERAYGEIRRPGGAG